MAIIKKNTPTALQNPEAVQTPTKKRMTLTLCRGCITSRGREVKVVLVLLLMQLCAACNYTYTAQ